MRCGGNCLLAGEGLLTWWRRRAQRAPARQGAACRRPGVGEVPHRGQLWWSRAGFKIRPEVFGLVELRGLEPLTPCLQNPHQVSGTVSGLGKPLPAFPGRSSLVLPRSGRRPLARQTGYKRRGDQQNRSCAQLAIVPYVHLGHADLRHPRGLHGSQHVQHESDSNFIARAIPG